MIRQKCIILASLWDHAFTSTLQSGEFLTVCSIGFALVHYRTGTTCAKSKGVVPPPRSRITQVYLFQPHSKSIDEILWSLLYDSAAAHAKS